MASQQKIKQQLVAAIHLHQSGDTNQAIAEYERILKLDRGNKAAMYFLGVALSQQGRAEEALSFLTRVMETAASNPDIFYHVASVHHALGQNDRALEIITQGLSHPAVRNAQPLLSLKSAVLRGVGRGADGLKAAQEAVSLAPTKEAYLALGASLQAASRHGEAIEAYIQALRLDPRYAEACHNMATVMISLERDEDAVKWLQKAIEYKKDYWDAYNTLGVSYSNLQDFAKALACYDTVLAVNPLNPLALGNKATILSQIGYFEEARRLFEKAIAAQNASPEVRSTYLMCLHYMDEVSREEIFAAHLAFDAQFFAPLRQKGRRDFVRDETPGRKLRIGMVSPSFRRHPVGYMILPGLARMDRKKFEMFAYSDLAPGRHDDMTEALKSCFDHWLFTPGMDDGKLLSRIEKDRIDILVDLTGHSEGGSRLSLFARRAAPVQVKWVGGLFNTSGLAEMDWLIGDGIEVPEGDDRWYTERVYRMPGDYICYGPPAYAPAAAPLPALSNGFVTFGNLNNPAKTNDASLALWAKVMKAVPGSRILFSGKNFATPELRDRVMGTLRENGIGEDRVILEYGAPHREYLGTYNRIDIALDPYPYSGGLTTCEALWMGVPVVSLPGPTFAGRHAATHLTHAGFPEWVVGNEEDYIRLAARLAGDLDGLAALRQSMRARVAASSLVDGQRFAQALGTAFQDMWRDWLAHAE